MLALLVVITGPQFLSLLSPYTLSYSHRAQKGCPQDVRELFKGFSTLTLLYRPTVMIQTTPHLTQGKSWLKGGEGTQVGHTPTSDAVQSPPSPRAVPLKTLLSVPYDTQSLRPI